jgi:ribosomal protein S12 methylthiotransferase accessory factor
VDLSPPGEEVRVVRAIVPGLEVETASYGRIGARNLRRMLRRDDGLVGTDAPPPGAERILLPEKHREEFGPAPWLDVGALNKQGGPPLPALPRALPPRRGPGRRRCPVKSPSPTTNRLAETSRRDVSPPETAHAEEATPRG